MFIKHHLHSGLEIIVKVILYFALLKIQCLTVMYNNVYHIQVFEKDNTFAVTEFIIRVWLISTARPVIFKYDWLFYEPHNLLLYHVHQIKMYKDFATFEAFSSFCDKTNRIFPCIYKTIVVLARKRVPIRKTHWSLWVIRN